MARGSRFVVGALVLLLVCGGAAWWLRHRDKPAAEAPEAARTVFLSHILFSTAKQSMAAARQRAEAAIDLITKGTPFGEVARSQSQDDLTRLSDGFMGPLDLYVAEPTAVHGAVQMLAERQLSPPVFTGQAWYVFYRHPYEEGRALERKWRRPCYAFRVTWKPHPGSGDRTADEAALLATSITRDLRSGALTFPDAKARYGVPGEGPPNGWRDLVMLTPSTKELFDRLSTVPEGGVPDPLPAQDGWIVLKRGVFFRSIVRHILVSHAQAENAAPTQRRSRLEALARAGEALEKAKADLSKWDYLVASYSDEVFSVADRGAIGCLAPGSLPPNMVALEEAIQATPPGELCPQVVETAYGFHVVWRVD